MPAVVIRDDCLPDLGEEGVHVEAPEVMRSGWARVVMSGPPAPALTLSTPPRSKDAPMAASGLPVMNSRSDGNQRVRFSRLRGE
jgi:hypothetical protein